MFHDIFFFVHFYFQTIFTIFPGLKKDSKIEFLILTNVISYIDRKCDWSITVTFICLFLGSLCGERMARSFYKSSMKISELR